MTKQLLLLNIKYLICICFICLIIPIKALGSNAEVARRAINSAFCGKAFKKCYLGEQGYTIVGCETGYTYSIWASNGQYKGFFQMGSNERKKYGFAYSPWAQATAAKKYFKDEILHGSPGWQPWDCAYRMGIL